jgi:hypothetical protein
MAPRHAEPWKSFLSGAAGGVMAIGTGAMVPDLSSPGFVGFSALWLLFFAPLALTLAGVGCGLVGVSWRKREAALLGFAGVAFGLLVPLGIGAWPPGSVDAVAAAFFLALAAAPYLVGFALAVRFRDW